MWLPALHRDTFAYVCNGLVGVLYDAKEMQIPSVCPIAAVC